MKKSRIEWTEETWNPTTGCDKVSSGCKNCYAETMAKRLQAIGVRGYENGFKFTLMHDRLEQPLKKRKPTKYFVNSMSDLFHEDMPGNFLDEIFNVIEQTPQHIYQVLTKRGNKMEKYFATREVPSNVWLGVTVEDRKSGLPRIDKIRNINASIKFLSIEPLLEDLGRINLKGINWVIVGGESGPKARPMKEEWVISIRKQCDRMKIPFFFKQWGGRTPKAGGRELEGEYWDGMPQAAAGER